MHTHILQPPLLYPPLLSVARKNKSLYRKDFLEMTEGGRVTVVQKGSLFSPPINIVKKVQTNKITFA